MYGHKIDMDPQNPPLVSDVRDVRAGCGCDVFNVSIKNTQKAHNHHNFKGDFGTPTSRSGLLPPLFVKGIQRGSEVHQWMLHGH
jgi:hypothetical protein